MSATSSTSSSSSSASAYPLRLFEGQIVEVCGLKGKVELNGLLGVTQRFNTDSQRWEVDVQPPGADRDRKLFKE